MAKWFRPPRRSLVFLARFFVLSLPHFPFLSPFRKFLRRYWKSVQNIPKSAPDLHWSLVATISTWLIWIIGLAAYGDSSSETEDDEDDEDERQAGAGKDAEKSAQLSAEELKVS